MASAIDAYDIALINANNPSVIDVYNLNGAFDATSFSTLKSNINSTWSSKTVVYHQTMNPTVIDGCNVTIDMNEAGSKTLATLIAEAHTAVTTAEQSGICTLTVNGPLSAADVTALNTAMESGNSLAAITGLNLGGATGMTQEQVNGLNIPTTLTSLRIPSGMKVAGNLITKAAACNDLWYILSPTSDAGATVPDYVWMVKQGGVEKAFQTEATLRSSIYVKVASNVVLTNDDMDLSDENIGNGGITNLQFYDLSEANLVPSVSASYKCPDANKETGYRIILPNNRTGDQMAIYSANANVGKIAAVYSYTDTKLNILEIVDGSYSPLALTDPRIMRSTTTEVEVVSGTQNGETYSNFGDNLLAAINNMSNPGSAGLNVKKVSISTGAHITSPMNFTNTVIETLELKNVSLAWAILNVDGCLSLQTLNLNYANIGSVSAKVSGLTKVDLSGATINNNNTNNTLADFSGAALTNGFITDEDTHVFGDLTLKSTGLTSFTPQGIVGGDIYLNASTSLASIDVRQVTLGDNKKIHIDSSAEETTTSLTKLHVANAITVPTGFSSSDRFHPYDDVTSYIKEEAYIPPMFTITSTDMMLHEKNANSDGDNFIYWYQDTEHMGSNVTIGTSSGSGHSLAEIITVKSTDLNFSETTYRRARITGPVTSTDIDDLASINCQVLDLSDATFDDTAWATLKTAFAVSGTGVHSSVRFVILPDGKTRDDILNGTALAGLRNVLSVISTEKITGAADASDNGTNLTTWSRVSGAVQAAVVAAGNHSCASWIKTLDGETARNIYTTDISDFKVCQISGLINSHDLSKANQQLDANGHLSWNQSPVEISSGTDPRTINGDYTAYGPFSASFQLTEIDLRDAYFEPVDNSEETEYKRYYNSDMTLSALGIISTATYKVVIPQTPTVREIPADFMNCSTNIRAICIPSNIRAIRTRAFYTIDYVWTTGDVAKDPEGANTKLDNGAKVKKNGGSAYESISATIYNAGAEKFVENPAFTKEYYVGDYSSTDGGGTYTIGSNIKLIETGAFANTQPNVTDVYVLNTVAPECHVDAFNTVMYAGNNGYSPVAQGESIIKRSNYYNGRWITMLHYPRQTTTPNLQRYTDPTRQYSIATGERDGKGAILYFPNQSEFIRAYNQGTYGYIWNAWSPERTYGSVTNPMNDANSGWDASKQAEANAAFNAYTSGVNHEYTSFYKVNWDGVTTSVAEAGSGTGGVVPYYKVGWNESNYSTVTSNGLYPQSEKDQDSDADGSGEKTSKDYRGWHQFVLNAYAANTILEEEPYRSYITDNEWWTICPEFDITWGEAVQLFGTPASGVGPQKIPYVSKLKYVRRMYSEDGNHQIFLNFSENLMEHRESGKGENAQHGGLDGNGVMEQSTGAPNSSDVIMSAGVPYLIKPNLTAGLYGGFNRQFRIMTDADYQKLTDDQKNSTSPRYIANDDLHDKIKQAQKMSGEAQMALIKSGTYTVPAFVHGRYNANEKGYPVEDVVMDGSKPKEFRISDSPYEKSEEWSYTFVGTFYKSFLPHYSYFLGWDSSLNGGNGGARFYYHDGKFDEIDHIMRWTNGTGVIVPIKKSKLEEGKFPYSVTPAADKTPAQWSLLNTFVTDDFGSTAGSRTSLAITFGSPDVVSGSGDVTGINEVKPGQNELPAEADVYTVGGQQVGKSVSGLKKGIYIVNGKKYVVK